MVSGAGESDSNWGELRPNTGEIESRRGEIGILGARLGFSGIYAVFKVPDRRLAAPANAKFVGDYPNARINIGAAASHASPNQPTTIATSTSAVRCVI